MTPIERMLIYQMVNAIIGVLAILIRDRLGIEVITPKQNVQLLNFFETLVAAKSSFGEIE